MRALVLFLVLISGSAMANDRRPPVANFGMGGLLDGIQKPAQPSKQEMNTRTEEGLFRQQLLNGVEQGKITHDEAIQIYRDKFFGGQAPDYGAIVQQYHTDIPARPNIPSLTGKR